MVPANGIRELLVRAHRRSFWIQLALQSIYALGIVCVGGSLLLLFGTQVLHPFWFWLLVGVTLGLVSYRLRQQALSPYRLAQQIDAACGYHDALSTALHFEPEGNRRNVSEPVRALQHDQAEDLARRVDLVQVFPFKIPRAAYVSAALLAVAAGLFAYRYGVTRKLSLQAPLVSFHIDAFNSQKEVAQQQKDLRQQLQQQLKQMGVTLNAADGQDGLDPNNAQPFNAPTMSASADNAAGSPGQENAEKSDRQANPGTSNEQIPGEKGDEAGAKNSSPSNEPGDSEGKDGSTPEGQKGASPQQGGQQNAKDGRQGGDNSLLNRLKDNLANMLNKLKSPAQNGEQQQQASNQNKQNQNSSSGESQKGTPAPSRNASNQNNSQGEQSSDQQGEGGEKSQSASSKQGDKSAQQPSGDAKSGVGKQDGEKDVRAAEQLAAMGKLSELLGKRSQNISGEMTVETPSGKQQLITPYSQRRVTHGEAGGESNRDEIPLAYQHYVQQYFEQIHKGKKPEAAVQKP